MKVGVKMNILFNADDFGLTKGVTDGIIKAHSEGVVGSTTLMMNGKATDYAVEQAKHHPTLDIGIHLVLTWGKPVSQRSVSSLIDENGRFKYRSNYVETEPPNLDEVKKEWTAQIEAFLATGLTLHHIDSHHHIHGWEPLKQIIISLAETYSVPVRYVESLKEYPNLLLTDALWFEFYEDGVNRDIFSKLNRLDVSSVEVMTHPSFVDNDLKDVSSYTEKRKEELDILTNLSVPGWVNLL